MKIKIAVTVLFVLWSLHIIAQTIEIRFKEFNSQTTKSFVYLINASIFNTYNSGAAVNLIDSFPIINKKAIIQSNIFKANGVGFYRLQTVPIEKASYFFTPKLDNNIGFFIDENTSAKIEVPNENGFIESNLINADDNTKIFFNAFRERLIFYNDYRAAMISGNKNYSKKQNLKSYFLKCLETLKKSNNNYVNFLMLQELSQTNIGLADDSAITSEYNLVKPEILFSSDFKKLNLFKGILNEFDSNSPIELNSILNFKLLNLRKKIDTIETIKTKIYIVDIWASWCNPCRKENKSTLKSLYEKYSKKGLNIISISIDDNYKLWSNANINDGIKWQSFLDIKKECYKYVNVDKTGLPLLFIFDRNRNFLTTNINGLELINFIENKLN